MSETTKVTYDSALGVKDGEPDSRNPASEPPPGATNSQEDLRQAAPLPGPLFPHLEHERAGLEYS